VLTGSISILIGCILRDVVMQVCLLEKFECCDELRIYYFLKQQFATLNCGGMWRAVQK
jgi:hypothetical protein